MQYAEMVHSVQKKNHLGGILEENSHESLTRLYSTGEIGDSYRCLSKYVQKLNPATTSLFPKTVTESQRSGYDLIREQPSWSEYTCNRDEGNLPWRWTVPYVYKSLGASNSHHTVVKRQRSFTPRHVHFGSCKRAKHFKL